MSEKHLMRLQISYPRLADPQDRAMAHAIFSAAQLLARDKVTELGLALKAAQSRAKPAYISRLEYEIRIWQSFQQAFFWEAQRYEPK